MRKEWMELFKHNNEPIKRFEFGGGTYFGAPGLFVKCKNGHIWFTYGDGKWEHQYKLSMGGNLHNN